MRRSGVRIPSSPPKNLNNKVMMKYQITLSNGGRVICDSYEIAKNNTITYKNGTVEVLMKEDLYDINSIERVKK